MRKIVMSALVAAAVLFGCAGPALAGSGGAGTTGAGTGTTRAGTVAGGSRIAEIAFLRAVADRYPASSAAGRMAAAYLRRLAVPAQTSANGVAVTIGTGISCASPTACLSVGLIEAGSGKSGTVRPSAARLHGGAWKAVPVKTPKGALFTDLTGVSCKAATFCLAVGVTASRSSGFGTYALTWNGTALTPVAAPPLPAHTFGFVTGGSCVAVKRCVAIGSGASMTSGATVQIFWAWNGTTWTRTTVPQADPNTDTEYSALHCLSVSSCVLIGTSTDVTSSSGASTAVVASWNGKALTDLKVPQPSGVSTPMLNGLSCVSAHSCAVVGDGYTSSDGTASVAFAEVWNGTTWTVTKWGGARGDTETGLIDVSCTSAVRCIAVGAHGTAKAPAPAALGWGGRKWTVLKVKGPGAGKSAVFASVSCPVNGRCVTTGVIGKFPSSGVPLAGYWNRSTWKYGPMFAAAA